MSIVIDSDTVPLQYSWHTELLTTWIMWRCSNFVHCYCVGRNMSSHWHEAFQNNYKIDVEKEATRRTSAQLCAISVYLLLPPAPLGDFSSQTFASFFVLKIFAETFDAISAWSLVLSTTCYSLSSWWMFYLYFKVRNWQHVPALKLNNYKKSCR